MRVHLSSQCLNRYHAFRPRKVWWCPPRPTCLTSHSLRIVSSIGTEIPSCGAYMTRFRYSAHYDDCSQREHGKAAEGPRCTRPRRPPTCILQAVRRRELGPRASGESSCIQVFALAKAQKPVSNDHLSPLYGRQSLALANRYLCVTIPGEISCVCSRYLVERGARQAKEDCLADVKRRTSWGRQASHKV